ncbi:MAG: tetratricopeptide repeat protein [Bacteroidales bacterium]|nr:tetratricopeptide repeat protein [Bacteroidales bacterium]MCB8998972.1 tetratricopeptide repeat protein [Bacteroidales bacterium]MCB9013741.1 tetratricopeptide repeat protein [Bacteroidales bacterium]
MKFSRPIFFIATIFLLFNLSSINAQRDVSNNPDYGKDSLARVSCANDLSTISEYMKINLPEYALPAWRSVFDNCPASSKNIYINGAKIYQDKIESAKDPAIRAGYFDTLMLIYDRRIQYFGEESYVLGRKGKDILRYNSQDIESAYTALKASVLSEEPDFDAGVCVGLVETGVLMYRAGKIPAKELLETYMTVSALTDIQKEKGRNPRIPQQVYERINAALSKAGLSNCDEIEGAFKEKVNTGSEDVATLNLISDLLQLSNCGTTEFSGEVNEKLFKLEPSPDRAYTLAWYFIRKEKFETAIDYFKKAIEIETDADKKAHYYYQMAILCNTRMNLQQDAVAYARKAIELAPAWGDPYFVIASAYVISAKDCFEGAFERSSVYWAATDKCLQAKSVDSSVTEKANSLISDYSRFYPNNEEVFFRSLQEGDAYTVGCWINEKTTVRVKK